ncbi:hypothetical protein NQ314_000683 [Rhamnusium bicolor]|uniref:Uncharacterized protein n=1 Tax=Rhamnusium bicolor TaxID=1586634 RepID=A0AAV8ZXF9_9CUCU|nr:hypothetical protein NQ314_000683 [Rhamnusium bicolor]
MWVKNSVPLSLRLYVFNWTNPEDIHNSSVKPNFVELGPYTYIETKEKSNIIWNANNTVTFKHIKKWWFDPNSSNGSLTDPMTTVNPIALSAAYAARNWNYFIKKGLSVTLQSMVNSVALTRAVGQVLFDGYEDHLLNLAVKMPFLAEKNFPKMDKFGWFYGRNESADFEGTFNMDTGVTGQVGELHRWRYEDHISYYPGKCGSLEGVSAGEFFPSNLKKESIIKFFSPDLCRFMELEFEEEVLINGIVGYKYSAGEKFLDNGTKILENQCFCDGDCMPSGAVNISSCRYGSPAFVSLPHFYKADPYYLQNIEGLEPDAQKSSFFMIFEPVSN